MTPSVVLAAATALALGARHGLDLDHLSAIADLVGTPTRGDRRSLGLALSYCVGHGSVLILLGALVGLLGVRLPGGMDRLFEAIVGMTLVGLGVLVLVQIASQRREYRFTSRWRVLLDLLRRAIPRGQVAIEGQGGAGVSTKAAFAVGVLHGSGAETPTQIVLFASAAAAGSTLGSLVVLTAFIVGLVASDLGIAVIWLQGRLRSAGMPVGQLAMGIATGVASIGVGAAFLLGRSATLPSLFGG